MSKPSPTSRTLARLKQLGFTAQVVERWVPQARKRIDLFGCLDLIAVREGVGILGIQACVGASHAARRTKMLAEPRLRVWLTSGGRAEIWSWSKRGGRGERKTWTLRREEVRADDLTSDVNDGGLDLSRTPLVLPSGEMA